MISLVCGLEEGQESPFYLRNLHTLETPIDVTSIDGCRRLLHGLQMRLDHPGVSSIRKLVLYTREEEEREEMADDFLGALPFYVPDVVYRPSRDQDLL